MERLELRHQPIEPSGSVSLYRETDRTYTVSHRDLYRTYSAVTNLTRKEANEEYKIMSAYRATE
jgi:hypothetical protein